MFFGILGRIRFFCFGDNFSDEDDEAKAATMFKKKKNRKWTKRRKKNPKKREKGEKKGKSLNEMFLWLLKTFISTF